MSEETWDDVIATNLRSVFLVTRAVLPHMLAFTRALAREVGPRGIHVNAIAPGPIETDLIGPVTDEWRREKSQIFALRRIGVPDDVAPTAVFLASDASRYYAGQTSAPTGATS
jgi:3-oxoacyl-[acyl-carrier protein] reductase